MTPAVQDRHHRAPVLRMAEPTVAGLSARQRQILELKCRHDLSHAEIGRRLGIAEQTAKNHVSTILARLGCGSMHAACYLYGRDEAAGDLTFLALRAESV